MAAPSRPASPEPSKDARALGAELKRLRLAQVGDDGKAWTQQQMAQAVYLGNKSAVSLYESGRRVPTRPTLELYATACACTLEPLLEMWTLARCGAETAEISEPDERGRRRRLRRWHLAAGALTLIASAAVVSAASLHPHAPHSHVTIALPVNQTDATTSVDGTVEGFLGDHLWLDVQAESGDRHHPTESPCERMGSSFHFGTLYVGTSADTGRMFRLSVIATPKGSAADLALARYARRPANMPDRYRGLSTLPDGSVVAASILVRRR